MKKKTIIISCIAAVLAIGIVLLFVFKPWKKEIEYTTSKVQERTVSVVVTATGYVQPVDKVEVGTQVSGVIEKIFVDYNSQVKKGQLLAELDKLTLNEKLNQAKASLATSQSDLLYAEQNYNRVNGLYEVQAATQSSYENAVNMLEQAKNSVANAKANLHQAEVNLSYAEIYSPINGVVLDRSVEEGQTVAASFSTPTLFTIANDLTKMQVEADVDEADIGVVKMGQKVTFTVDAYGDDVFEGTVNQIRLQPTVTNNVVTYTVIIEAPNPEEKLYPGMTANITIITNEETALSVPASALTFTPSDELIKQLKMTSPENTRKQSGKFERPEKMNKSGKTVWIKDGDKIYPKPVQTSIGDGIYTIVSGVNENDEIILFATVGKKAKLQNAANPFMPQGPRR